MLVCSSGAGVSSGGMVMDRLGGFRLCRRLLDTEETLSPFLSAEAMAGWGAGRLEKRRGHGCVETRTARGDACARTGNRISSLLVCRPVPHPASRSGQGQGCFQPHSGPKPRGRLNAAAWARQQGLRLSPFVRVPDQQGLGSPCRPTQSLSGLGSGREHTRRRAAGQRVGAAETLAARWPSPACVPVAGRGGRGNLAHRATTRPPPLAAWFSEQPLGREGGSGGSD